MSSKLLIGAAVLAIGGTTLMYLLGDGGEAVALTAAVDSVRVIEGPCPTADSPAQEAAKCKGSIERDGLCYCITDQELVDGEIEEKDAPRAQVKRLWVCPGKTEKDAVTRWDTDADVPPPGCTIAAKALVDVTMGDYSTDLVEQLKVACAPCQVTGSRWGACPRCIIQTGGCAAACPVEDVEP